MVTFLEKSGYVLEKSGYVLEKSGYVLEKSGYVLENSGHFLENNGRFWCAGGTAVRCPRGSDKEIFFGCEQPSERPFRCGTVRVR